jgi:hypothetical protein
MAGSDVDIDFVDEHLSRQSSIGGRQSVVGPVND